MESGEAKKQLKSKQTNPQHTTSDASHANKEQIIIDLFNRSHLFNTQIKLACLRILPLYCPYVI
jgi:tRNA U34 5-carboxymethylaminomethyl modifying enzyme MnmG/GidA